MHTLFNGLIKEKFVVLNFAEAFRLHTNSIIENIDKLTVFQDNPLVPPTNNNIEQYYSATLQQTEKKRFRCNESLALKLKIVREKWNNTIGNIRFPFMEFLQLFAKIFYLFAGT